MTKPRSRHFIAIGVCLLATIQTVCGDVRDVQREIRDAAKAALDKVQLPPQASDSDVLLLNEANFDIITHKPTLLEFFAPWCGHCKHLAPTYEKVGTELKKQDIQVAKIDCTVSKTLCYKFGIQGYPTIKYARAPSDTEPLSLYEYNERSRDLDAILRFATTTWKQGKPGHFPEFIVQLLSIHAIQKAPTDTNTDTNPGSAKQSAAAVGDANANITEPVIAIRRSLSPQDDEPSTFQSVVNSTLSSPWLMMLYIAFLVCIIATCVYALCDCKLTEVDPHKQT